MALSSEVAVDSVRARDLESQVELVLAPGANGSAVLRAPLVDLSGTLVLGESSTSGGRVEVDSSGLYAGELRTQGTVSAQRLLPRGGSVERALVSHLRASRARSQRTHSR